VPVRARSLSLCRKNGCAQDDAIEIGYRFQTSQLPKKMRADLSVALSVAKLRSC
jgi:hypothetical protein